jgi:type IV secretion system protein VirB6
VVQPVLSRYAAAMRTIYDGPTGLVNNFRLHQAVNLVAVLYIIIYAIYFLLGAVQVTVIDLLSRIVKIIIVVNILFSSNSWEFFNTYLFSIFLNGTNQLINIFAGAPGSVANPFSFLDPVFNTYISAEFWKAIFIQLLQFWNGMGLLALLVLCGVVLFFSTLLEIVMSYVLAFILIYILVGLAPIFIPMMLFSSTKSFFVNWISIIFKNALQPAILIALILIFDQFMDEILAMTMIANKWGCLKEFHISFNIFGMDLNFPTAGFCLPFYIPKIDTTIGVDENIISNLSRPMLSYVNVAMASFLYFTYSLVVVQLVGYTNSILNVVTGMVNDNAVSSAVGNIQQKSAIGKAFNKGSRAVNKYIASRSPVSYDDTLDQKLVKGGGKAIGYAKASAKASAKAAEKGWDVTKKGYHKVTNPKQTIKEVKESLKEGYQKVSDAAKYVKDNPGKVAKGIAMAPVKLGARAVRAGAKAGWSAIKDTGGLVGGSVVDTAVAPYKAAKKAGGYIKGKLSKDPGGSEGKDEQ